MHDNRRPIKSRSTGWAKGLTKLLLKSNITPNQISVASVVFAALGILALIVDKGVAGSILCALGIQLRLLCNLFDGILAMEGGKKSAFGSL
jgi:phosphatidylglycerophosphate synthase